MKFLEAVLILSGMIIGVGMFGIPYSFAVAGFWLGVLELAVLAALMILVHILYAELVVETATYHRLPGYVKIYLGRGAEVLSIFAVFFGTVGSLIAYILIGAIFLQNIISVFWPGSSEIIWALAIVVSGAAITLFPLRKEALINGILTAFLIGFIAVLVLFLLPGLRMENLAGFEPGQAFLPYGVLLFSLAGGIAIPDLVGLLRRERARVRKAVIVGTVIPALVYFLFALAVVGVSSNGVSEEAFAGLRGIVSDNLIFLGSIIGFLAVYTSYIILTSNSQALLRLDFRFPKILAWVLASLVPLAFYLAGFQSFILIIGAVGAVAGGIDIALIVAMFHRLRKKQGVSFSVFSYGWKVALILLVSTGVIYELYRVL